MFDLTKQVIGNFAKGAGQGLYNAAQASLNYFKDTIKGVQDGIQTPIEASQKVKKDVSDVANKAAISLLKETGAGATSLLKGVVEAVIPGATAEERTKLRTTTGPVEEKLFGRVTKTPQQVYEDITGFVKEKEGSQIERAFLPLAGTLGYVFMESPVGLPVKSAKIPLDSMEFIAKSGNQNVIRELIKENIPEVSTRTLNRISKDLVNKNTLEEVVDYFGGKSKIVADLDTPNFSNQTGKLEQEAVKKRLLQTSDKPASLQTNHLDTLVDDIIKDPSVSSLKENFTDGSIVDVGRFQSAKESLGRFTTAAREKAQDSWIRIKQMQNKFGVDDYKEGSPYSQYVLSSGRVEGRNRGLVELVDSLATDYKRISEEFTISPNQFRDEVNKKFMALQGQIDSLIVNIGRPQEDRSYNYGDANPPPAESGLNKERISQLIRDAVRRQMKVPRLSKRYEYY